MPKVGDTIGEKYRLLSRLGEGGMSEVFCAENVWMSRRVAIKTLLPGLTRSERIVQRFWQEARIASQIDHPNIARVLDIGIDPALELPYIVQELLEGESLRDHLKDRPGGRVPPDEALALMGPMLRALAAVHRQNILHRDLKPGNIFLVHGKGGTIVPKLIDFGISKILAEADEGGINTRTGTPLGTPLYMSPEQAAGQKDVDAQADVWSMGVVLYEMLAGRCPYEGDNHNVIIAKILRDPATRIEKHVPDMPRSLAAIVHRAIEPDRARRFKGAKELLDALEAYEAGGYEEETRARVSAAAPPDPLEIAPPSSGALRAPPLPVATPVQWSDRTNPDLAASRQRDRQVMVAALASMVMVIFATAFALTRQSQRRAEVHTAAALRPPSAAPASLATTPVAPTTGVIEPPPIAPAAPEPSLGVDPSPSPSGSAPGVAPPAPAPARRPAAPPRVARPAALRLPLRPRVTPSPARPPAPAAPPTLQNGVAVE